MIHTCQTISQGSPAVWATTDQVHGNMYGIDLGLGLLLPSRELQAFFNGKTSSVSLIFTHRMHRNVKNRWVKATFHLLISMHGQCATGKYKGIISITGVAGSSLTGKTSSVSLIFTHRTRRNVKNH